MKKNRKIKLVSIAVVFLFSLTSCKINLLEYSPTEAFYRLMQVERRAKKIEKLNISSTNTVAEINTNIINPDETVKPLIIRNDAIYNVLVITDVHFGNFSYTDNGKRRDADWFKALENEKDENGERLIDTVKFAIGLGDFAEHGYLSECEDYNKNIRDPLEQKYGIPLYNIVGNHDLYNSGWNNWQKTMYPHTSFYKFETPSFSWYFIDSASGTLGGYQLDALQEEMLQDSKKKLVFSHVPVYSDNYLYFTMQNTDERNKLISTCAATSTKLFVDGHTHKQRSYDFGAFFEQNIASFITGHQYGIIHVNEIEDSVKITIHKY